MRALLALRALARIARCVVHLLHGMAVMSRFPRLSAAERHARIGWWSAALVRHLGLGLQVDGVAPRAGATLVVANHVSWLDIAAIHAAMPQVRFVSKADVLAWPLLGWLIRGAGTLFIERASKRDALRVVHAVAEALERGESVAVFPEGTTGAGPEPLPFHANLLQAAVATSTPVQPVVLRYAAPGERFAEAATFLGETTLVGSFWKIATARGLVVHVTILPPVATAHADRRSLAEHLRQLVADGLAGGAAASSGSPAPSTAAEAAVALNDTDRPREPA